MNNNISSKVKTHVCILGFNFYITWKNDDYGYDQHGTKWINKINPECTNKEVVNVAFDTYNKITNTISKNKFN